MRTTLCAGDIVGLALEVGMAVIDPVTTVRAFDTRFPAVGFGDIEVASPVRVAVDAPQARPGDAVTIGVEAHTSLTDAPADLYVWVMLPDFQTLVFLGPPGPGWPG
jgi:hypothetical protein